MTIERTTAKNITIFIEQTKPGMIIITFPNIYINHSRIIMFLSSSSHDITQPMKPERGFALYSPKKTIDSFFVNNLCPVVRPARERTRRTARRFVSVTRC